jgi:formate/nitrite transporter
VPDLKAPAAIYDGAVAAGAAKASASWAKIFKLGIAAGCHIGFGSYLAITVGGACPQIAEANPGLQKIIFGAFGLPFGLIMTLVTGGELFTGNTALVTAAAMEGKATKSELIKSWVASYGGNFVGSLLLAFLAFKSGTLGNAPASVAIATAKCSLPFDVAFVRGILCNWLVCMAVYMASGCASLAGKMVAVWFPISAFVALGLDHSVANMFIIPLGMMRGAKITMGDFIIKNLIPVTLGNIVGGALCVMGIYGTAFGKWFASKSDE